MTFLQTTPIDGVPERVLNSWRRVEVDFPLAKVHLKSRNELHSLLDKLGFSTRSLGFYHSFCYESLQA